MSAGVSLEVQLAAARREVGMRERVYPRWVASAKMSQDAADRELAAMRAIRDTLARLVDDEKKTQKPGLFG